jgi:hypothetical protein
MFPINIKDINEQILQNLPDKDLVNACQTNRQLREICQRDNFWLNRIRIKFPYLDLNVLNEYKSGKSWNEYYIELSRLDLKDPYTIWNVGLEYDSEDYLLMALAKGVDVNSNISEDFGVPTAIGFASINNKMDLAKFLIKNGADINYRDQYGETPLTYASGRGYL